MAMAQSLKIEHLIYIYHIRQVPAARPEGSLQCCAPLSCAVLCI